MQFETERLFCGRVHLFPQFSKCDDNDFLHSCIGETISRTFSMAGMHQTPVNYLNFFKYFGAYYFAFFVFFSPEAVRHFMKKQLVYLIWHQIIFEGIKLVATWAFLQFKINSWPEAKRQTGHHKKGQSVRKY